MHPTPTSTFVLFPPISSLIISFTSAFHPTSTSRVLHPSIHPPLNQYTYNNHCEIASIHPFVIHHLSRHALLSSCFISDIPISASHVSQVCLSPFPSVFLFRLTFFIRPNVVSIPRHWNISTSTYIQHTFLRPRSLVVFQHSSNLLPCSQSQILRPLSLSLLFSVPFLVVFHRSVIPFSILV